MASQRTTSGLLLLVVLACTGFVLTYVPSWLVAQYEALADADPVWVTVYFVVVATGGLLLFGCSVWIIGRLWLGTRRKRKRRVQRDKTPSQLTDAEREKELDENLGAVDDLKQDQAVSDEVRRELEALTERLTSKQEERRIEIVAFGSISSGKSALLNALAGRDVFATDPKGGTTVRRNEVPWPGDDQVILVDTPGLGEIDGAEHVAVSAAAAKNADLVLLVVDGPLRDSEFRLMRILGEMEKRVIVCLNKSDWYVAEDRRSLLSQLAGQLNDLVRAADVVGVQAEPTAQRQVQVTPAGAQVERTVEHEPDITALAERMTSVVQRDGRDLLLSNLLLQSRGLLGEARQRVRESLDRRAQEIVEKYSWGAGGAAAISPFPVLDLAAGSAVTVKMVVELARVYRQDVDMDAAVNLLGQLGKNLIAILGVSAATPAVTSVVASLLKTVPGAGTIAGGVLQGVVQAVVTRWIGAVFMKYFGEEMRQPEGGLASLARAEWDRVTSVAELRKIVRGVRSQLRGRRQEGDDD